MIFTTGRYGMKLALMPSSCIGCLTSIYHPLEALIGSSFVGVLARVKGSRWLIQAPFFGSPKLLWIKRQSFTKRWWCGRLNKTYFYIFILTKFRVETLDPTPHAREEEYFLYFSRTEVQPTLNFSHPHSQIFHAKNHS